MKFFKPGLYIRYNSDDDVVANCADRQWEKTIRAYKEHLAAFSDQMSEGVKYVAESLCLHDAERPFLPVRDSGPSPLPALEFSLRTGCGDDLAQERGQARQSLLSTLGRDRSVGLAQELALLETPRPLAL